MKLLKLVMFFLISIFLASSQSLALESSSIHGRAILQQKGDNEPEESIEFAQNEYKVGATQSQREGEGNNNIHDLKKSGGRGGRSGGGGGGSNIHQGPSKNDASARSGFLIFAIIFTLASSSTYIASCLCV